MSNKLKKKTNKPKKLKKIFIEESFFRQWVLTEHSQLLDMRTQKECYIYKNVKTENGQVKYIYI